MKQVFLILSCFLLLIWQPCFAEEMVDGVPTESGKAIVNPTITGGTIDNTPIGSTTPSSGAFTTLSVTQNFNPTQGSDVASANAMTLGNGNLFDITGTTTINTIASKGVGTFVILQFDGILQLTHSNDLFLPTAANITTAAGDVAMFYEYASGDWRCLNYMRADGTPLYGGLGYGTRTASATDYNPSALTTDYIIAITNTDAARAVTISTEDEDSGSTGQPRIMIVKDESGGAAAHNITVSLESSGNIDGSASYVIDQNYQSITIYLDGTNAWIY